MGWIWHLCFMNMKRRRVRTFLTVLGVTIGVISVVALLSIGIGVKKEMIDSLVKSGTVNRITVYGTLGGKHKDRMITDRTIERLGSLQGVKLCYPMYELDGTISYGRYYSYGTITGVPAHVLSEFELSAGELKKSTGIRPSLLIGNEIGKMLYNDSTFKSYCEGEKKKTEALAGKKLDVMLDMPGGSQTVKLEIGGVISPGKEAEEEKTAVNSFGESEEDVEMTYDENSLSIYCDIDVLKSMLRHMSTGGTTYGQPVDANGNSYHEFIYSSAVVVVSDIEQVDATVKKLKDMGFQTENEKEYLNTMQKYLKIIQLLLGGIGMIALVVAVIGISNTMTTSVFDRINEIGILKVLGCDIDELRLLFLTEAAIIGAMGGAAGVALSYLVKLGIDKVAVSFFHLAKGTQISYIPWWLAVGGIVGSIILGILAGYFPARWASKLRPIDAVTKR